MSIAKQTITSTTITWTWVGSKSNTNDKLVIDPDTLSETMKNAFFHLIWCNYTIVGPDEANISPETTLQQVVDRYANADNNGDSLIALSMYNVRLHSISSHVLM